MSSTNKEIELSANPETSASEGSKLQDPSKDFSREVTAFPPRPADNFFVLWFKQLLVMLKTHGTLSFVRYWRSTVLTILAPIAFLALLYMIQEIAKVRGVSPVEHPVAYETNTIPPCVPGGYGKCIKVLFTPDTLETRAIIRAFDRNNNARTGKPEGIFYVRSLTSLEIPEESNMYASAPNEQFIYDFALKYPNVTEYGITFDRSGDNFRYLLWFNQSLSSNTTQSTSEVYGLSLLSMMRALDEAILEVITKEAGQAPIKLNAKVKDWPTDRIAGLYITVVRASSPLFFFCGAMINFLMVVNSAVAEKELKLRHGMQMMGLMPSVYWTSHLVVNTVVIILNSLVTCAAGYAFQFEFFINTNFSVVFLLFFMYQLTMIFFAFLIVALVPKVRTGTLVAMFILIIGLVFMLAIFGNSFVGYIWWEKSTSAAGWLVLMFFPFFNFGKLYLDISVLSIGLYKAAQDAVVPGPGFSWESLFEVVPKDYLPAFGTYDLPVPAQSLHFLVMNMFFYGFLAWYFDNTIPDQYGNSKPFYFFLTPSFWGIRLWKKSKRLSAEEIKRLSEGIEEDDDVHAQRLFALDDKSEDSAVRLLHLRKVYGASIFKKGSGKAAVEGSSWTLQEGKLMALLGQNGAGKTTTINMLCGFSKPTKGEAYIFGNAISTDMSEIRSMMGVCPQHDILFHDLTAQEHIELFAGIKNIPRSEFPKLIEERLGAVRLLKVKDKLAGSYSGGMKRRLSVAISTIGDPKIVFMDEPTTGMDPVNRRHVWGFIEKFKKGRAIILTTHSMEEADILGDDIAIMALGRLRAYGSAIHLKGKFGAGYRISLVTESDKSALIQADVLKRIPGSILEDDSAGALIFMIPNDSMKYVSDVVSDLENKKLEGVKEWGISQSTLEEVFLKIIRDVNPTNDPKTKK